MIEAIAALRHWLVSRSIDHTGVQVTVTFPGERARFMAERELKMDTDTHHFDTYGEFGTLRPYGIALKLRTNERYDDGH